MTFSAMVDALFADPILAKDALYTPDGGPVWPNPVRVMVSQPDALANPFGNALASATTTIEVRVSEIAEPGKSDTFAFGGAVYTVNDKPLRDDERLVWKMAAVPQP
jgi:hypothetical protein